MDFVKLTVLPSAPESAQIAESSAQGQQLAPPPPPSTVHMALIKGQRVPLTLPPPPPLTVHMADIDGRRVPLTPPPPPPFQSKIFPPPPPLPPGYGYCYDNPQKNNNRRKPFRPTLPPIPEDYILLRVDQQNKTLKLAKVDQDEDQLHSQQAHVDQHAHQVDADLVHVEQLQARRSKKKGSVSVIRRKLLGTLRRFCACY